jgi:hypothetical protein
VIEANDQLVPGHVGLSHIVNRPEGGDVVAVNGLQGDVRQATSEGFLVQRVNIDLGIVDIDGHLDPRGGKRGLQLRVADDTNLADPHPGHLNHIEWEVALAPIRTPFVDEGGKLPVVLA